MSAVWLAVMLALAQGSAHPETGAERLLARTETLLGAWNGRWLSQDRAVQGSMGLVVARTPGTDAVVGQFTFVTGGVTRSFRSEGRIDAGRLEFSLVGAGWIVLEPLGGDGAGSTPRLRGEWTDVRGALPTRQGVIELARTD